MFKEILLIFYFKNHFLKHFLEIPILTIVINHSVSTELLNFLLLLEKKYEFIKVKQINNNNTSKDLNTHLLINSANNISKLNSSNLILLIGLNTRLESSTLNIKLRQRFLKGNCKIFTINSLVDLTFPTTNLGSNINILKNIVEGTHFFCQELKFAKNPILIYNSTLFSRNDSSTIDFLINSLNDKVKINLDSWKGINCVSSALNEVGINLSGLVKTFKSEDFMYSSGLYFINSNIYSTPILKLLELKILNYFKIEKYSIKYLIEQNNVSSKMFNKISNYVYIGLPNFTLFEDSGTYQNSEGIFKNMIQVIPSQTKYSKSNWHILRRLFSCVDNNMLVEKKIILNFENYSTFIKFNNFQVYPVSSLNKYVTTPLNFKSNKILILKKYLKQNLNKKLFKTKTILWLDDFYIGGKDLYSKFSKVMIECSKSLRLIATNFTYNV